MKVQCWRCGKPVVGNRIGRPKRKISFKRLLDAYHNTGSVKAAASELGGS